jgi:16S rRNA (guanine(527)-N(7))-methyltransferase RsmG
VKAAVAGPPPRAEHRAFLEALGVPQGLLDPLDRYLALVADWNQKTNLTGAGTPEERVRVLVEDPWRASTVVRAGSLIDVGSGNGSPGMVLALLRPDVSVTLLEPRARRWAFLREAARRLDRPDVGVERARSDTYQGPPAGTVTLRGLDLDVDSAGRLADTTGEVLFFGGAPKETTAWGRTHQYPLRDSMLHVFTRR